MEGPSEEASEGRTSECLNEDCGIDMTEQDQSYVGLGSKNAEKGELSNCNGEIFLKPVIFIFSI